MALENEIEISERCFLERFVDDKEIEWFHELEEHEQTLVQKGYQIGFLDGMKHQSDSHDNELNRAIVKYKNQN